MDLKSLVKKTHTTKDQKNCKISKALYDEIKKTQEMLEKAYKKRNKRSKKISFLKCCDFVAHHYRLKRYKFNKNG